MAAAFLLFQEIVSRTGFHFSKPSPISERRRSRCRRGSTKLLVKGLHHIGVPVQNMDRAEAFYVGILGLTPCEQKSNWLFAGDHFSVHLMPSRPDLEKVNPARHFTLEVARLEEIAGLLLTHGLRPYQLTVDQARRHDITSADEPLDFGIGTIFVEDPDGNTVEFLQRDRGITAEILGSAA
jgi:catechol 2,3-dioxygenase-like lactoylglutathione lyase family enzyme